ncbi:DNA-binding transcriptional LysR family regulator [Zymomonas mobilis]|uniref:DNA-binding transcriptional LysR family regulator n=2 Tax=Zymomonas mobilis TaxID=542 RepID=A0A542W1W2_ZYMMB|nr:DNA-binding transcriptional LysR family regulator [Zymomonas mobilis]
MISFKLNDMMRKIDMTDITRFDFNLIITFLALWHERSVTKAATRLSLSQSAVSAALSRLRQAAGDVLFVRTRQGMEPTQRAIDMVESLSDGAALIHQAFTSGKHFDPPQCNRHFSIGMSDDFQLALGAEISKKMREIAPNASILYRQTNRYIARQMLENGDIDLAIVTAPLAHRGLSQEIIGEGGYACLCDAEICGFTTQPSLDDYLSLPHVLVSYSGRDGLVDEALSILGLSRQVQTALTHFAALPPFLLGAKTITTIPSHAAISIARYTGLKLFEAPLDLGNYPIIATMRHTSKSDAALLWLLQIIKNAVAIQKNILLSSQPENP